ncbi:hypothetical protein BKA64DRAFT_713260 [Cadophora sp. MPI-SDFR-AT-0126]|nr:hypothetical protein BKA64DRAFT_713260 [Leotiomycetes sp. MPI-SDFR-AT-0126]
MSAKQTPRVRQGCLSAKANEPSQTQSNNGNRTANTNETAFSGISKHSSTQDSPTIDLTTDAVKSSTMPSDPMIQVLVHNPSNSNDVTSRPTQASILSRSPYFRQRIQAIAPNNIPVLYVTALVEHYDIVINWLCTNNVRTRDGSPPDFYTLVMVIFLADVLQLIQMTSQMVNMLRTKQFASNEKSRPLPTYFDVYQRTTIRNPLRRFVVEAYIKSEVSAAKAQLVDIPAAMLVDIILYREEKWGSWSENEFEDRLAKVKEELKVDVGKRFNDKEKELVDFYEDKLAKARETTVRLSNTAAAPATPASTATVVRPHSVQVPTIESISPALLEEITKAHEKPMEEVEKKNDERYNALVELMRQRNVEHLEAVQTMNMATVAKEAREIKELHNSRQQSIEFDQPTKEDYIKEIAELRSIIKSKGKKQKL